MSANVTDGELRTAAHAAAFKELKFTELGIFRDQLWWIERDPRAGNAPMLATEGCAESIGEQKIQPENSVYGYGGGSWSAQGDELAYVEEDGTIHRVSAVGNDRVVLPAHGVAFGDLTLLPSGDIVAIREQPVDGADTEHSIVLISCVDDVTTTLAQGADFYLSPRASPSGRWLAHLSWDKPGLAWHAAQLTITDLKNHFGRVVPLPGTPREIHWISDNRLLVLIEGESYDLWTIDPATPVSPRLLWRTGVELGAIPWELGLRSVAVLDGGDLAVLATCDGRGQLWVVNEAGAARRVELPFTAFPRPSLCSRGVNVFVVAGAADMFASLIEVDVLTGDWRIIQTSFQPPDWAHLPTMRILHDNTDDGLPLDTVLAVPAQTSHCPAVIFDCHSGPTDHAWLMQTPLVWYLTSIGFAVAQVNYRGSTGFGSRFRDVLGGAWGLLDAADVTRVIGRGAGELWDAENVFLRGESAGGFTILAAAGQSPVAGLVSLHGAVDGDSLMQTTHKFEADYVGWLLGESRAGLASAIDTIREVTCPALIVAGDEDPVVPVTQARELADALRDAGCTVSLEEFHGEGHGLTDPEAIHRALVLEGAFYLHSKKKG